MPSYEFRIITNRAEREYAVAVAAFSTDKGAIHAALKIAEGRHVEVWRGMDLVFSTMGPSLASLED